MNGDDQGATHHVDLEADGHRPRLPADRAFVVQFRLSDTRSIEPAGRVEHLVSGAASNFTAWADLRRFVESMLDGAEARPSLGGVERR